MSKERLAGLKKEYDQSDLNKDGKLTFEEFQTLAKSIDTTPEFRRLQVKIIFCIDNYYFLMDSYILILLI